MIKICEYENKYKGDIIRMILKIERDEYHLPTTEEDMPDLDNIDSYYKKDGGNFWVAVDGGEVVGTVAMKNIGNGYGMMRKMFVSKEYRGKQTGVSQGLLDQLLLWAKQKKIINIYLGTITQFKAAHRFYERNGFNKIEKEKLPESFPVIDHYEIFYCYILSIT